MTTWPYKGYPPFEDKPTQVKITITYPGTPGTDILNIDVNPDGTFSGSGPIFGIGPADIVIQPVNTKPIGTPTKQVGSVQAKSATIEIVD